MSTPVPALDAEVAHGLDGGESLWVSRFHLPEGSSFGQHEHRVHQLAWAATGTLVATVGSSRWLLTPAQALWIPGRVTHDITASRRSTLVSAYVWPDETPRPWPEPQVVTVTPLAGELMHYLAGDGVPAEAARAARATLLHVLEPATVPAVHLPMPRRRLPLTVATAILADSAADHALETWAGRLHVSSKTLQRGFVHDTGMPYSEWRSRARLHLSLPLLVDGLPVSAVAARIGYGSDNGYVAAFRRHFGCTPSSYVTDGSLRS